MSPSAPSSCRAAWRAAVAGLLVMAAGGLAAGIGRRPAAPGNAAAPGADPAADFLIAAGDSTYWVTRPAGGAGEVHVRASPLFLARWGGRLAEVYVTEDERAFDDGAWFVAQRVYRRDLLTGDSALVFADPSALRLAARYAAAHPGARLLTPDDPPAEPEDDEHAAAGAETTVSLAGVHGAYLSMERRTAGVSDDGRDVLARRVIDLRTGREATLASLFGATAAGHLAYAGRAALVAAVDSLRLLARRAALPAGASAGPTDGVGDAPQRALGALATLRFDAANFGLTEVGGRPAVAFVALGRDADGAAVSLTLPPVAVPAAMPAWWRDDVAPALLVAQSAAGGARPPRWRPARGAYEVRARQVAGASWLELVAAPAAATARAWPLARIPAAAAQLFPLDDAPTRRALRRAFDESAFYDEATTSVAWRPAVQARRARPSFAS